MRSAVIAAVAAASLLFSACGGDKPPVEEPESEAKKVTPDELLAKARADRDAGRVDQSIDKYRRALVMRPEHFETASELTRLLIAQNQGSEAVEVASDYFDRKGLGEPPAYQLLAEALMVAGENTRAYELISDLIKLDDKNALAYNTRARVQVFRNQLPEAVADARKAVELDGSNIDFHIDLGSILKRSGSLGEAAIVLRSAVKLDEKNPRAHMLLGIVLRDNFEVQEAMTHHMRAARYGANDSRNHYELGLTLFAAEDPVGAEQSLSEAVRLEPENPANWYAYGQALRNNKSWGPAEEAYKKTIDLDPKNIKARVKLGIVMFEQGKLEDAEVVLTIAQREDPKDAYIYWNLGEVYRTAKKQRLAISAYEKFLELAPAEDGDRKKASSHIKALRRELRKRR